MSIASLPERTVLPGEPAADGTGGPVLALRIYLLLLVLIPSVYVIGPLGAAGVPASLMGCLLLGIWLLDRLQQAGGFFQLTPVHVFAYIYLAAMLLSFTAGMLRPLMYVETNASIRGLLAVASALGVLLFVTDLVRTRERLDAVLGFLVLMASVLALMGLTQFLLDIDFIKVMHFPGLVANTELGGLYQRSGFARVSGTAIHSIEYAAVLGMVLPVAVQRAVCALHRQWLEWGKVAVIVMALPLTVSRSGVTALVLGLVYTFLVLDGRGKLRLLLLAPVFGGVVSIAAPGLLRTLRDLFLNAQQDSSVLSRVSDYDAVQYFVEQDPLLGRGLSTFLPTMYRVLDNQYLGILVEAGVVGLLALVTLIVGPVLMCLGLGRRVPDRTRLLEAAALAAGLVTGGALLLTFDGLGFPMCAGVLWLLIGAAGANWRIGIQESRAGLLPGKEPPAADFLPARGFRYAAAALTVLALVAAGAVQIARAAPVYEARKSFVIQAGAAAGQNIYFEKLGTEGISDILAYRMRSQAMRALLAAQDIGNYEIAVGGGSTAPQSDVSGYGDLMAVATRSPQAADAVNDARAVAAAAGAQMHAMQENSGVDPSVEISVQEVPAAPLVYEVPVNRRNALAGLLALAVVAAAAVNLVVGRIAGRFPAARLALPPQRDGLSQRQESAVS